MPISQVMISTYPKVNVPTLAAISSTPIRDAVAHRVEVFNEVLAAHAISGAVRSGNALPADMPATEVSRLVILSGESDAAIAEAVARYVAALDQHGAAWKADANKRLGKARTDAIRAVNNALAALAEFEIAAGVAEMLDKGGVELVWKPPAEVFELHAAVQPLQTVLDRLTRNEDQAVQQ